MFIAYLLVIATGLIVYSVIGLTRGADNDEPLQVVTAFNAALEDGDGQAACALLSEEAQSALERERRKPCERGVVEVSHELSFDARATDTDIAESSAIVTNGTSRAVFLDRHDGDWFIGAAGCERQAGDAPFECELEG